MRAPERLAWLKFLVALASPTFLDVPLLKTQRIETPSAERIETRNELAVGGDAVTPVLHRDESLASMVVKPNARGYLLLIWPKAVGAASGPRR